MRTNRNEQQKAKMMELVSLEYDQLQADVTQLDQNILQVDDNSSHKKSSALKNMHFNQICSYLLARAHEQQLQSEKRTHPFIKWSNYAPADTQQDQPVKWFEQKQATLENCLKIISRFEEERDESLRSTQQNLSEINEEMLKLKKSLSDLGINENQDASANKHEGQEQGQLNSEKIDKLDQLQAKQKLESSQNNQVQNCESQSKEDGLGNQQNVPENKEQQRDPLRYQPQKIEESHGPTNQQQEYSKQEKVLDTAKAPEHNEQKLEYYQQTAKELKDEENANTKYQQIFQETNQSNEENERERQEHKREEQCKQQVGSEGQQKNGQEQQKEGQKEELKNESEQSQLNKSGLKESKIEGSPQKRKSIFEISSEFNEVISTKKYYENVKNSKDQKFSQLYSQQNDGKELTVDNNMMSQQLPQHQGNQQQIDKQKLPPKPAIIETETMKLIKKFDQKLHKIFTYYFKQTNAKKKGLSFDQKPQGLDLNTFIRYLKDFQLAQAVELIVGRDNIKSKISPDKKKKIQEKNQKPVSIQPVTIKNKKGSKKSVDQSQPIPAPQVPKQKQPTNRRKPKKPSQQEKQEKVEQTKKQENQFTIDHKANEHPHLKYHHTEIIQYLTKLFKKLAINSLWLDQDRFHLMHDDVFQLKQHKESYLSKIQQAKLDTQDPQEQQIRINDVPVPVYFLGMLKEIHKFISDQKIHKFLNINVISHISNVMNDHPDRLRSIVQKHTQDKGQKYEQHREQILLKIRRNRQDQQRRHQIHAQKILQRYKQQHYSQEQQPNKNIPSKSKSMQKINSYAKVLSLQKQKQKEALKRKEGYALDINLPKIKSQQHIKSNNIHDQYSVHSDNLKSNDSHGSPKNHKTLEKRTQIYRELNLPKLSKRKLREQSIYEQLGQIQLKGQPEKIKRLISEADEKDNSLVANNKSYSKGKKKNKLDDLEDDQLFKEYFQHEKIVIQKDRQKDRPALKNRMKFT